MSDQFTAALITAGLFGIGTIAFAVAHLVERHDWVRRALDAWLGPDS